MRLLVGRIYLIDSCHRVVVLNSEEIIRGKCLVRVRSLNNNKEFLMPVEKFEGAQLEMPLL